MCPQQDCIYIVYMYPHTDSFFIKSIGFLGPSRMAVQYFVGASIRPQTLFWTDLDSYSASKGRLALGQLQEDLGLVNI